MKSFRLPPKELRMSSYSQSDVDVKDSVVGFIQSALETLDDSELKTEIVQTVLDYSKEFTPWDTGAMYNTAFVEGNKIVYPAPQAQRLYYGDGYHFKTDKHPLATERWLEWTMLIKGTAIKADVEKNIAKELGGNYTDGY